MRGYCLKSVKLIEKVKDLEIEISFPHDRVVRLVVHLC